MLQLPSSQFNKSHSHYTVKRRVAASSHGTTSINNKPEQHQSQGESVHAQEVKRYTPCLLEHQKYPRCEEQLCGWRLPLGSHAPALCLFQLHLGSMGEAHSRVVCPTRSHTLRFCALHLIAVTLSWGAICSHSLCSFAAIIPPLRQEELEAGTTYGQNIFVRARHCFCSSPVHRFV